MLVPPQSLPLSPLSSLDPSLSFAAARPRPLGIQAAPINPTSLNHAPAPIPTHSPPVSSPLRDTSATDQPFHASTTGNTTSPFAAVAPVSLQPPHDSSHITVADAGVPLSAGADGPGPRSGNLGRDNVPTTGAAPHTGAAPGANEQLPGFSGATHHESAEEEKARLARQDRESLLHSGTTSGTGNLSAEDEKARLERAERERVLHGQQTQGQGETGEDGKTVPPPYADF